MTESTSDKEIPKRLQYNNQIRRVFSNINTVKAGSKNTVQST